MKCPTEIASRDRREFELSNLGFMPLIHCKGSDYAGVHGGAVVPEAQALHERPTPTPTRCSTKFNYLMCVARFAHYLKVMARDKIGSFMEVKDCERLAEQLDSELRARQPRQRQRRGEGRELPLRDAKVEVREVAGKPGWYEAVCWLRPHFQLETLRPPCGWSPRSPRKPE